MKRANLFLLAAVGLLVAAGCSGPSRGVEVENPTPEIGAPTAYRNMTVGVEIGYPADWTFREIDNLQVRFQPLNAQIPVATDVVFAERSPPGEDLADIAASLSPGVSFSEATLGDFECVVSGPTGNGASELLRLNYCDLGGYFMVVEHRSLPTAADVANQFSFRSVAPDGSGGLQKPKVTEDGATDDDAGAEKVDCQADPKNPACLKKSKKICKAVKGTDSDCDGLSDKTESFSTQSDPSDPDSDDDGILDGQEMSGCVLNPNPACKG